MNTEKIDKAQTEIRSMVVDLTEKSKEVAGEITFETLGANMNTQLDISRVIAGLESAIILLSITKGDIDELVKRIQ